MAKYGEKTLTGDGHGGWHVEIGQMIYTKQLVCRPFI